MPTMEEILQQMMRNFQVSNQGSAGAPVLGQGEFPPEFRYSPRRQEPRKGFGKLLDLLEATSRFGQNYDFYKRYGRTYDDFQRDYEQQMTRQAAQDRLSAEATRALTAERLVSARGDMAKQARDAELHEAEIAKRSGGVRRRGALPLPYADTNRPEAEPGRTFSEAETRRMYREGAKGINKAPWTDVADIIGLRESRTEEETRQREAAESELDKQSDALKLRHDELKFDIDRLNFEITKENRPIEREKMLVELAEKQEEYRRLMAGLPKNPSASSEGGGLSISTKVLTDQAMRNLEERHKAKYAGATVGVPPFDPDEAEIAEEVDRILQTYGGQAERLGGGSVIIGPDQLSMNAPAPDVMNGMISIGDETIPLGSATRNQNNIPLRLQQGTQARPQHEGRPDNKPHVGARNVSESDVNSPTMPGTAFRQRQSDRGLRRSYEQKVSPQEFRARKKLLNEWLQFGGDPDGPMPDELRELMEYLEAGERLQRQEAR